MNTMPTERGHIMTIMLKNEKRGPNYSLFWQLIGFEPEFFVELLYFSELGWITYLQSLCGAMIKWYLWKDTKNKLFSMLCASVKASQSPKTATDWTALNMGNFLKTIQLSLHHSIARTHIFLHVKFQGELFISFWVNSMCKKSGTFSWRMVICSHSILHLVPFLKLRIF